MAQLIEEVVDWEKAYVAALKREKEKAEKVKGLKADLEAAKAEAEAGRKAVAEMEELQRRLGQEKARNSDAAISLSKLQGEKDTLLSELTTMAADRNKVVEENVELKSAMEAREREPKESRKLVAVRESEVVEATICAELKVRAELMQNFIDNRTNHWDPEGDIRDWREFQVEESSEPTPGEAIPPAVVENAPNSPAPVAAAEVEAAPAQPEDPLEDDTLAA